MDKDEDQGEFHPHEVLGMHHEADPQQAERSEPQRGGYGLGGLAGSVEHEAGVDHGEGNREPEDSGIEPVIGPGAEYAEDQQESEHDVEANGPQAVSHHHADPAYRLSG